MKKIDSRLYDYFIAVYDYNDNYLFEIDSIEESPRVLNMELKEIVRKIKNGDYIRYDRTLIKLYLVKKELEEIKCMK